MEKYVYGSGKAWKTGNFFLLHCGHPVLAFIANGFMLHGNGGVLSRSSLFWTPKAGPKKLL